jgi:hypothetical protein
MHIGRVYRATFSIGFCLAALVSVAADRAEFSGFLGDYSQLESITDRYVDYVYAVPDFRTRMAQYRTFIVPLPEIYIAADSEYKTIDRADRNVLAEAFRESFLQQLTGKYVTVTRPGPETAMIRIALTDVDFETIKDPIRDVEPRPYGDSEKLALRESLADKVRLTVLVVNGLSRSYIVRGGLRAATSLLHTLISSSGFRCLACGCSAESITAACLKISGRIAQPSHPERGLPARPALKR